MKGPDTRDLPVTIDWFRQEAYWIAGLSTAAIGSGTAYLKDHALASNLLNIIVILAGSCFLGAMFCSVVFYLFLTKYANQLELCKMREKDLDSLADPQRWRELKGKLEEARREKIKARKGFGRFYPWMVPLFGAGVLLTALLAFTELKTHSTTVVVDLTDETILRIRFREMLRESQSRPQASFPWDYPLRDEDLKDDQGRSERN